MIDNYTTMIEAQFTAMETTLATLQSQSAQIAAELGYSTSSSSSSSSSSERPEQRVHLQQLATAALGALPALSSPCRAFARLTAALSGRAALGPRAQLPSWPARWCRRATFGQDDPLRSRYLAWNGRTAGPHQRSHEAPAPCSIRPPPTERPRLPVPARAGQIVLLYQGAIRFATQHLAFVERREIEKAHSASIRSQEIVAALRGSLDLSAGPIAIQLDQLYDFVHAPAGGRQPGQGSPADRRGDQGSARSARGLAGDRGSPGVGRR